MTEPGSNVSGAVRVQGLRGHPVSGNRLAVLGSPIAHSHSPALHAAAYSVLGRDWTYSRVEVDEGRLCEYITSRDETWRGLSLTMPLKRAVLPFLTAVDTLASDLGVVNTVLFAQEGLYGFNTDVEGIIRALAANGATRVSCVQIIGAGATAASALVAAAAMGARNVEVYARDTAKAKWLQVIADRFTVQLRICPMLSLEYSEMIPGVVVSTLPGAAAEGLRVREEMRRTSVLLDAAYDPWPSPLALAWHQVGGRVVSGIGMLIHQALIQIRIFVTGDPLMPLENEPAVLEAMFRALHVDEAGLPRGNGNVRGSVGA